ncbi:MAG: STAS-like domain-containing protein [Bacteroides sp.]|nr:STAS-like domain-containing protein [Bacteroides sp.]
MESRINIAKDFSPILGGRFIKLGPHSGEEFYNTLLKDAYLKAIEEGTQLIIELDGTKGYPSSFLDASFGELAREYGVKSVRETLILKAEVFIWVVEYINKKIWDEIEH